MVKIPRNGGEERKPSFFKIILPGYSTEHLRIPPRFLRQYIVNKLAKRATLKLKRSSEYSWHVKVRKSGGDMYLGEGWQEFMRDTCLGDKEFLVFIYNGRMCFSIKIFDKSGCERMDFPDITSSKSTKKPGGRASKSSIGNSADKLKEVKEKEPDYNSTTEKSTSKGTEMPRGRPTKTTEENSKRRRGRPRKATSESTKWPPVTLTRNRFGRPRNYPESGELFKSNFTTKILRLSQVYMPKPFYGENLSSGNYEVVFLKNSEGTKWYKVGLSS